MRNNLPYVFEFVKEHATVVHVEKTCLGICNIVGVTLDKPLILNGAEHWTGIFSSCVLKFLDPDEHPLHITPAGVRLLETRGAEDLLQELPLLLFLQRIREGMIFCLLSFAVLQWLSGDALLRLRIGQILRKIQKVACKVLFSTMKRFLFL